MSRAVVVLLACLAVFPATSSAAPKKTFTVSVEATHTVGWSWRDEADGQECRQWTRADGDELTKIETTRRGVMNVIGTGAQTTVFLVRTPTSRAKITRSAKILEHRLPNRCTPCGPLSEYGPCGPEAVDWTDTPRCGPRESVGAASIAILRGRIIVYLSAGAPSWVRDPPCPRVSWSPKGGTVNDEPPAKIRLPHTAARIFRLKRGASITLSVEEGRDERGEDDCNTDVVTGYDECAVTGVRVTFRRTR